MSKLFELISQGKPLIAAHRGMSGGNIPPNTAPAFLAALAQGAEIIELDVTKSADGELFIFHPGMEKHHLGFDRSIKTMEAGEIRRLRYINHDGTPTDHGLITLREALELLRDKCVINIDKFERYPALVAPLVRDMGMQDQVLVKSAAAEERFRAVEEAAPDLPYIAIVRERDDVTDMLRSRSIRYLGTEVIFSDDASPLATSAYTAAMHDKGLITWVNAIVYDKDTILCGGHSDDVSIVGRPDHGWGWLIERGYDIIQTDWISQLRDYRSHRMSALYQGGTPWLHAKTFSR